MLLLGKRNFVFRFTYVEVANFDKTIAFRRHENVDKTVKPEEYRFLFSQRPTELRNKSADAALVLYKRIPSIRWSLTSGIPLY